MKMLKLFLLLLFLHGTQAGAAVSVSVPKLSIDIESPLYYDDDCFWVLYSDGYIRNSCYPDELYLQNNYPYYDAPYYFYNDYGYHRPFYGKGLRSYYSKHHHRYKDYHHGKRIEGRHHKKGMHHRGGGGHKGAVGGHRDGGGHKGAVGGHRGGGGHKGGGGGGGGRGANR